MEQTGIQKIITLYGLVQGVGFRPYVAEQAVQLGIAGSVRNAGGIVIIHASGNEEAVNELIRRLREEPPAGAVIDHVDVRDATDGEVREDSESRQTAEENTCDTGFREELKTGNCGFSIIRSTEHREAVRILPPDLPTCPDCERELLDPDNRRYRYPFISCASCGPRFSIMTGVPYDRKRTTMHKFSMCPACRAEYEECGNSRCYAQTISCHDCGPVLRCVTRENVSAYRNVSEEDPHKLLTADAQPADGAAPEDSSAPLYGEAALQEGIRELRDGRIGAVKDIGGFHFVFRPDISDPARRLRGFKHRASKPFAVMFPDVESIRAYCTVSAKEEELLRSPARPIVLLKRIYSNTTDPVRDFAHNICGESDRIGAMLPCNPLQILLVKELGPLVMTSGNRGGEPIITRDEDMLKNLSEGCPDFILTHNREIVTPLEHSIYQLTELGLEGGATREVVKVIRRARGIVPAPLFLPAPLKVPTFAAGGDLKSVFALGRDNVVYLSSHFGDLSGVQTSNAREVSVRHMEGLLDVHPVRAVADSHPSYISHHDAIRMFGEAGDGSTDSGVKAVQHHKAHIASVIAEYGLKGPVIGVSFDGTGYGDDGTIWGSEFMLCDLDEELSITYQEEKKEQETLHAIPMNDYFDRDDEEPKQVERKGHFLRMGHLMPVKMLGGDMSSKNAIQTLTCYIIDAEDRQLIWEHVSSDEILDPDMHQLYEIALAANVNTHFNGSMGRLFDAASAQLGICQFNTYEGECAEKLECAAQRAERKWKDGVYSKENPLNGRYPLRFVMEHKDDIWLADGSRLIGDLRMAVDGGVPRDELALEFHDAVAEMTVNVCEKISWEAGENGIQVHTVALSGGTFCNRILLQRIVSQLTARGFRVYINEKVPSGDGGIALGQMALADIDC